MYKFLRKIHLYSGLVLLLFTLMYFVTGFVMTHHKLFPAGEPTKTTVEHTLSYQGPWLADELGTYLKNQFNLPGRLESAKEKDGTWTVVFANAGQWNKVVIAPSHDKLSIERTQPPAANVMTRMHRFHGYNGGAFYILWAIVYDLTSVAMIVFAITGVYLWYKLSQRRLLGWLLLATSFGFSIGVVLYLMYAP